MRLIGTEGSYGEELGLDKDWAARIIRHVGNYGEAHERNVGPESRLKNWSTWFAFALMSYIRSRRSGDDNPGG